MLRRDMLKGEMLNMEILNRECDEEDEDYIANFDNSEFDELNIDED